ncbi:teneurin-3 [Elysia marginata]|uniref:Teneurin-3 n=1 Tax=Elysia marginata TaxID=1093978 RepID=A0AAV4GMQ7_9GAST|nr:teneurin-3 [Elysia marginata]
MEMASSAPLMNGSTIPSSAAPIGSKTANPPRTASLRHAGGGSVRAAAKKARMRNRGSQTCSSDDEDLHSDDNLRPYEEVKVAQNDKNLAHFEHALARDVEMTGSLYNKWSAVCAFVSLK